MNRAGESEDEPLEGAAVEPAVGRPAAGSLPEEALRAGPALEVPFRAVPRSHVEQEISFALGPSACRATRLSLREGTALVVTTARFAPGFAFSVIEPAAELELVLSKGAPITLESENGERVRRGGDTIEVSRVTRAEGVLVRAGEETRSESVSVSLTERRLLDLLGLRELPAAFRAVTEANTRRTLLSRPLTPRLGRLHEEIVNADVSGAARLLWHEAKALELVALLADALDEMMPPARARLSAHEVERLERARRLLVARLEEPPTLTELARAAGFSETVLKARFRALFGTSVFAYLRRARMHEAQRLLQGRSGTVTEIAQRVGYLNPSKFAAAFLRELGRRPSAM